MYLTATSGEAILLLSSAREEFLVRGKLTKFLMAFILVKVPEESMRIEEIRAMIESIK